MGTTRTGSGMSRHKTLRTWSRTSARAACVVSGSRVWRRLVEAEEASHAGGSAGQGAQDRQREDEARDRAETLVDNGVEAHRDDHGGPAGKEPTERTDRHA